MEEVYIDSTGQYEKVTEFAKMLSNDQWKKIKVNILYSNILGRKKYIDSIYNGYRLAEGIYIIQNKCIKDDKIDDVLLKIGLPATRNFKGDYLLIYDENMQSKNVKEIVDDVIDNELLMM